MTKTKHLFTTFVCNVCFSLLFRIYFFLEVRYACNSMKIFQFNFLKFLIFYFALCLAQGETVSCGLSDPKVTFADGSSTCLKEFPLFNLKGVLDQDSSQTFISKIKFVNTYAISTPSNPLSCPYVKQMSWDWSGNDGYQALPKCQSKLDQKLKELGASSSQDCKCIVLIDNGKTKLSRSEFTQISSKYEWQIANSNLPFKGADATPTVSIALNDLSQINADKKRVDEQNRFLAEKEQILVKEREEKLLLAAKLKQEEEVKLAQAKELTLAKEREEKLILATKLRLEEESKIAQARELALLKEREEKLLLAAKLKKEEEAKFAQAKELALAKEREQKLLLSSLKQKEEEAKISQAKEIALTKLKEEQERKESEKQAAIRLAQDRDLLASQNRLANLAKEIEAAKKSEELRIAQLRLREEEERRTSQAKLSSLMLQIEDAKKAEESRIIAQRQKADEEKVKLDQQARVLSIQNRYALVIGNNNYKSVMKLENATEDAKAIAEGLQKVGFKVTLKLDLTEKEMKSTFRTFKNQISGGDEVLFFYAGHGVQLGSSNYLIPIDTAGESEEQIRDDAMPLQRILDDMTEKRAKLTVAMVDACRDNPFKTVSRNFSTRGLAPTSAATGQMIIYSAGTGQQALDKVGPNDKNKNGLFTRVFLKEMQKPGVTIDKMVRTVRNEVVQIAKSVGHEQVPAIYDQVVGDFFFLP